MVQPGQFDHPDLHLPMTPSTADSNNAACWGFSALAFGQWLTHGFAVYHGFSAFIAFARYGPMAKRAVALHRFFFGGLGGGGTGRFFFLGGFVYPMSALNWPEVFAATFCFSLKYWVGLARLDTDTQRSRLL